MTLLVAIPGLESLHPMIIHFPIALLLVAPLFIVIAAMLPPPKGQPFMISALVLLALGTASLFFAIPSGEAAAQHLYSGAAAGDPLSAHQNLGFETRGIFVMLLVLYVSVMLVPKVLHRDGRLFSTVLPLAFLLLYCAGAVVLVNAAHEGGKLAHDSGSVSSSPPHTQVATHSGN